MPPWYPQYFLPLGHNRTQGCSGRELLLGHSEHAGKLAIGSSNKRNPRSPQDLQQGEDLDSIHSKVSPQ